MTMKTNERSLIVPTSAGGIETPPALWSRRRILRTGATFAIGAAIPRRIYTRENWRPREVLPVRDPQLRALAMRAIDSARSAGAQYADVRLTYTRSRDLAPLYESDELAIGVRACVQGCWGFASSPEWTVDSAARVGQLATTLATDGARHAPLRNTEFSAVPVVADGDWSTPIKIDPFDVSLDEMLDWCEGTAGYVQNSTRYKPNPSREESHNFVQCGAQLYKQSRVFASTEGSYMTQTVYVTSVDVGMSYWNTRSSFFGGNKGLWPSAQGWEYALDVGAGIPEWIRREKARIEEAWGHDLPLEPAQIGRYDTAFDAAATAALIDATLAPATQLDRILGYEANAGGTSYLGVDPLAVLGTHIASPLVTLTANRSAPKALATVRWDDEGVMPDEFPLITNGILVDCQTTRETAPWLAPWYHKQGRPIHSHGCAQSESALDVTLGHTPNLAMASGSTTAMFDDLIANISDGIAIEGGDTSVVNPIMSDQQHASGEWVNLMAYRVKRGKRVARIVDPLGNGPGVLFRSAQLWGHVKAIGGPGTQQWFPIGKSTKGEPEQTVRYSIAAVPILVTDVALIDPARRA